MTEQQESYDYRREMLRSLELIYYSEKFKNSLFLLSLEKSEFFEDLLLDIRILQSTRIDLLIICRFQKKLKDKITSWNKRGEKFEILELRDFKTQSEELVQVLDQAKAILKRNRIPVIFLKEKSITDAKWDSFSFYSARALKARKVFFLSKFYGLEVDKKYKSSPSMKEVRDFLKTSSHINIGKVRLKRFYKHSLGINSSSLSKGLEIILLEGSQGSLYEEIFTHKGDGTLFSTLSATEIRQAKMSDILSIYFLIQANVETSSILPMSEEEIAKEIGNFFIYTMNGSLVATALLKDYGKSAELAKFATIPRFQGKGRAKELAQKLIDEAKKSKKEFVFSLSIAPKMWSMFESLGFKETSREKLPLKWKKNYDFERPSKAWKLLLK